MVPGILDGGFDEGDHGGEGLPQFGVVVPDVFDVAAGIVLCPKLVGETVGKVLELGEPRVEFDGIRDQGA